MGMDGTVHPVYVCELTSTSFRGGCCTASQISLKIGLASKKEGYEKKCNKHKSDIGTVPVTTMVITRSEPLNGENIGVSCSNP
jgi:hypothetical protein